jgi:monoamine oxidase
VTVAGRVLVVGAGLSGLTVAYRLGQAGVDVTVLEARERVGGRAWRVPVGDAFFDAGCESFDREHRGLLRLAHQLGVHAWEAGAWGDSPRDLEGADADLVAEFEREVDALAARVDPAHPEELEDAGELDGQSLAGWLEQRGASSRALEALEASIAVASSSVPTREMSFLAYAVKRAAGADPTGLTLRFEGGPTALAERLAQELDGRVLTGAAVVRVEGWDRGVSLRLQDGATEHAGRAVIAVPLTLQREIDFDPPLPEPRRRALAEARYGEIVKQAALFDTPPAVPDPDLSPDGHLYAAAHDPRLLIRFAGAGAARSEVRLGQLVGMEPRAEARVDWPAEPWTRGSYLILGPGQLLSWGNRLAEAHGRIHFAGADRSALKSYMEGAVRAGEETAAEVLATA